MAAAKDDASTDIEAVTKTFAKDMTDACAALRKAAMGKAKKDAEKSKDDKKKKEAPKDPPEITFALDPSSDTKVRTPAQQAAQVVAGRSWVCWSSHMSDKARHVIMKVDGKVNWDPKKALGDDFDAFKKEWAKVLKSNGLKNANGGDGWFDGDAFHVELADSKISKTDERAAACLEEYARLSRKEDKGKNDKFEKEYSKELKSYLEKYEKKDKK